MLMHQHSVYRHDGQIVNITTECGLFRDGISERAMREILTQTVEGTMRNPPTPAQVSGNQEEGYLIQTEWGSPCGHITTLRHAAFLSQHECDPNEIERRERMFEQLLVASGGE